VLLADTAGRLQNQQGLMDELAKIRRVIARRDETAPHEVMLVLDASQQVPVRFIGIGEKADDMQPFIAEEFVDALLASGGQD
jgi:fused signal recognition particle receptor